MCWKSEKLFITIFQMKSRTLRNTGDQSMCKTWSDAEGEFLTERDQVDYWKNKYLMLLEKYNELLSKNQ